MTAAVATALLSAVASFVGAWVAARFALDRFRHEKIWEKRAATYTAIFESLQDVQIRARDDSDDGRKGFEESREAFRRRVGAESRLVSDRFRLRMSEMERDARRRPSDNHFFAQMVSDSIPELRAIARKDLSVEQQPTRNFFFYTRYVLRSIRRTFDRTFRKLFK